MSVELLAVTFDASEPRALADFWGTVLGRESVQDGNGWLLPGTATQVGLRFSPGSRPAAGPNQMHLHLTSDPPASLQATVAASLAHGAGHLDFGQGPDEGHVVLADPSGNEFCIIKPGNNYLAGCGLLGEIACDGTRTVGLFWSAVLGWPLVWDQDEETAIQSPVGGTKVAWGGPPVRPVVGRSPQRFELITSADAFDTVLVRVVGLGATLLTSEDGAELTDPDGNTFLLRTTAPGPVTTVHR